MKEKFKKLMKNMGLLLISNFSSKILVFLLVPLYTSVLSTKEYGIYDLMYSTIQLIYPILTINIVESIFRFTMDKNSNKKEIFTIGIKHIVLSFLAVIIFSTIAKVGFNVDFLQQYQIYFVLLYLAYITNDIFSQFTRSLDKVKDISIAGILGTVMMISSNIIMLLYLKRGLEGYFISMILSLFAPAVFLLFKNKLWKYIKISKNVFKISKYEKQMLLYSLPLIFITIGWQINNVADRYTVTLLSGIEENGVYSISYKIPAILNAIQVVFIQAWQISAIKEFGSSNKEAFYTKTYKGCQVIMITLCSLLIIFTKLLAKILFANEFYMAWIYVPILLIYIVFNTLSGTLGAIFSAAKDTKKLAISGIAGALTNIVLNFILVYKYGAMGAAVATLISSIVIWLIRMLATKQHVTLKINYFSNIIQYILLTIQAICFINIENEIVSYTIQILLFIILTAINIVEMKEILMKVYKIKMYIKKIPGIGNLIERVNKEKLKKENINRKESMKKTGAELVNYLTNIFEENNYDAFLNYGSLLGIIRDGKFIEHDCDIDFGIFADEKFDWNELENILKKYDVKKVKQFKFNNLITEQSYKYKDNTFDIFACYTEENNSASYLYYRKKGFIYNSPNEYSLMKSKPYKITKTKWIEVNGIKCKIPEDVEKYLESIYTKDWRIPNPNWVSIKGPSVNAMDDIGLVEFFE